MLTLSFVVPSDMRRLVKQIRDRILNIPTERDIDLIVKRFIENNEKSTFAVIGANDAKDNDIIKFVIDTSLGRGCLVEPQPSVFSRLKKAYSDQTNLVLVNAAIDRATGQKSFYSLNFSESRWATGLASFNKKVIIKHFENGYIQKCAKKEEIIMTSNFDSYIKTDLVQTVSVQDLARDNDFSLFNVLFIDTEGNDANIIRSIDLSLFSPNLIYFEHIHLVIKDYLICCNLLRRNGYILFKYGRDTLAIQKTVWESLES